MSRLRIYGENSGYVEIKAPDSAGDAVIEIPDTDIASKDYVDNSISGIPAPNSDEVAEGSTNLYYTDARVETVISNSDTDDIAEGSTNLYYTESRVVNYINSDVKINELKNVNADPLEGESLVFNEGQNAWVAGTVPAPKYFPTTVWFESQTITPDLAAYVIETSGGAQIDITVPPNSQWEIPVGTVINICPTNSEAVVIVSGSGVTIRHVDGFQDNYTLAGPWAEVSLRKRATDEWVLVGQVA